MRAGTLGRALRFTAPALAVASIAAAGGSVAASALAGEQPCTDPALGKGAAPGGAPLPCEETVPPSPTVTEPGPVEEPPQETEPAVTAETPPVVTTTTPDAPPPARPPTKRSAERTKTAPAQPAPTPTTTGPLAGSGIFGGPPDNGTPKLAGGPYVFPVIGPTSFGDTWGAFRATTGWHHGVDIFAPLGSPIVAVADGALFSVGWNRIGGRRLWLRDRVGNYFYYAHLSAFARVAVEGARVRAGTVIGYVGHTGDAEGTPYHLHFEVHPVSLLSLGYDGAVNPFPYVSSWRRLDHDDISTASGMAPAPAPGAFLLAYTDISSASGLSPASLRRTVERVTIAAVPVDESERLEATASRRTIPSHADAARIARSLDSEAGAARGASLWDRLAVCESGGDWGANTGNGFVGGLQFLPQTWESHGGRAFAPSPNLATREQQIAVAERVLDSQGWRAWPICSAVLGLQALGNG